MGDNQTLLLVLGLLYLMECLVWVPRGAVVFTSWWNRRFRVRHPGDLLGNTRGGWHLAAPFPPLGTVVFCQQLPFSVSPQALYAYSALCLEPGDRFRHSAQWWPWDKIESISIRDRTILVNGTGFCRAASPGAALFLARWLEQVRSSPENRRPESIRDGIQAMLARDDIQARWRLFQTRSWILRVLANVAFLYLFLAVPGLLWRHGWVHVGWWLLGGLLIQTITITLLFQRAHRTLFPKAREERFKRVLTMLLAPPTALRAPDFLGRPLFEPFHLLGVARFLLRSEQFRTVAKQCLADLHYPVLPICPNPAPEAIATEQWSRQTLLVLTEQYLRDAGLSPETLLGPPEPTEPANRTYCPRCFSQFTAEKGSCLDCGGRPLLALKRLTLSV